MWRKRGGVARGCHMAGGIPQRLLDCKGGNKAKFPLGAAGTSGDAAETTAVHILLPDPRLGETGTLVLEVRHGQGAEYQYNVRVPNLVLPKGPIEGVQIRIGFTRDGEMLQGYAVGH